MLDVQRQFWEEGYTRLKVKGAGRKSRPNMKWYMGQEVKEVKRVKRKKKQEEKSVRNAGGNK